MAVIRRFFAKVRITDGCWEWEGAKTNNGHASFWFDGHSVMAHRFAYELMVGPVPDGLVMDHACRNRACVRPDHVEPVTQSENVIRGAGNGLRRTRR